jgi:hypothetical protein
VTRRALAARHTGTGARAAAGPPPRPAPRRATRSRHIPHSSGLVAAARLQGSRHYFSQVVLGWFIGWLAVDAVNDSAADQRAQGTSIEPVVSDREVGLFVTHRF